jgi:hypothetical protein
VRWQRSICWHDVTRRYWPGRLHPRPQFFRTHFTVGSKAAFIALPTFGVFWWATEKAMARCDLSRTHRAPPR